MKLRERSSDSRATSWAGGGNAIVVGIVALALVFDLICASVLWRERADARQQVLNESSNLVNALARDIDRNVEVIDLALLAVQDTLRHRDLFRLNWPLAHSLLFQRTDVAEQLGAVLVTDADGRIVMDSATLTARQGGVKDYDFFREVDLAGKLPYIGVPRQSPLDGLRYVYISRRLGEPDTPFSGIVYGSLKLDYFNDMFTQLNLGPLGSVLLVRGDGRALARWPAASTHVDVRRTALFEAVARAPYGNFVSVSPFDGVTRLVVYRIMPKSRMVLSVGRSLDDIYAPWQRRARAMGLVMAAVSAAMLTLALALVRQFRRRRSAHQTALRNAALFRGALHGSPIGTALIELDGRVSYVNPALARMLDYTQEELLAPDVLVKVGSRWADWSAPEIKRLLDKEIDEYRFEWQLLQRGGRWLWTLQTVSVVWDQHGEARYFIAHVLDISARKAAQGALYAETERLRITLSAITDGVVVTDAQGGVAFMNPIAARVLGLSAQKAVGQAVDAVFVLRREDDHSVLPDLVGECLNSNSHEPCHASGILADADGTTRDVECSAAAVRTETGEILGAVLVVRDVSEARELQRRLVYNASHDALTGLPNRNAFETALHDAIERARRTGRVQALAFLDLDRFKIINDSAGHAAGDALLREVASLLRTRLRKDDIIGRLGGDEFGVLLHDCPLADARARLEKLIEVVHALQFEWENERYTIGVSIGVTDITGEDGSSAALLTQADVACYAAKKSGRNRISVYRDEQSQAIDFHRKILVAAGIRRALDENRFTLYAQRVASTRDAEEQRYEILIRMRDSTGAAILPSMFVPAAERYDLMGDIDRWVLHELAATFGARLRDVARLKLHVNLSANSLNEPGLLEAINQAIEESGLPSSVFVFEITETALIRNTSSASTLIEALRARGCEIALDDFGIGLSFFGYLRSFTVDLVKIDGNFVVHMANNPVDRNIVMSIHRIASELGAQTVAESVEDEVTLGMVRAAGIHYAQGYAIHRPEPLATVIETQMPHAQAAARDGSN